MSSASLRASAVLASAFATGSTFGAKSTAEQANRKLWKAKGGAQRSSVAGTAIRRSDLRCIGIKFKRLQLD
eukprot:3935993-Alexandrium_andersonii.AAC.1